VENIKEYSVLKVIFMLRGLYCRKVQNFGIKLNECIKMYRSKTSMLMLISSLCEQEEERGARADKVETCVSSDYTR
jgi:hypothetical protein